AGVPHLVRHPPHTAVFRYPLAVSLRTPVASSMRRKDHPSFPRAITCCFFSSLKTLLMPREPIRASLGVNVPGFLMAGFQVTLYGRFWVTAEAQAQPALERCRPRHADPEASQGGVREAAIVLCELWALCVTLQSLFLRITGGCVQTPLALTSVPGGKFR